MNLWYAPSKAFLSISFTIQIYTIFNTYQAVTFLTVRTRKLASIYVDIHLYVHILIHMGIRMST